MSERSRDDKELDRFLNVPFLFGLEAQGHIPTIQMMLSAGSDWDAIGRRIGWCPKTAREHYGRNIRRKLGK